MSEKTIYRIDVHLSGGTVVTGYVYNFTYTQDQYGKRSTTWESVPESMGLPKFMHFRMEYVAAVTSVVHSGEAS